MRTLLIHLAKGYSLRETVVKAKLANIADVSDVALLKCLRCSEGWLKRLCEEMFIEKGIKDLLVHDNIQMRLVDGTNVKEPGETGSLWRIHYSLKLPNLQCDYFSLTSTKGKGTGESFTQFPINKNDCIIGDRGYSTAPGIEYIDSNGGYSLVRVNTQSLLFYNENKSLFKLLEGVSTLEVEGQADEWDVCVKRKESGYINGRLCVVRKSKLAIEIAIKKLKKTAIRKQRCLKDETLEFAKYIIVFTTLPRKYFPMFSVLEWYRLRWQIELIFKRLKSLAGLGHLPKHDASSSRAWLYGKLFAGLLVEKLISHADTISPWDHCLG